MPLRPVRRAAALAVAAVIAFSGVVSADALRADGDVLTTTTSETLVDLGEFAPGATVVVPVGFELVCSGSSHPDAGQTVVLAFSVGAKPSTGQIVSVTPGSVGPVPEAWPDDGATCPSPPPALRTGTASTVTLRAPTTPNVGYTYTIGYARSLSPAGGVDGSAFGGTTSVSFRLAVVTNRAPVLTVPGDLTVEGDTTGGWVATYPGVSATDAEDDPDPVPACSPVAGSVLPLGTTTVSCTVTDLGGRTASGAFDVTVADTTAPVLDGLPPAQAVTTDDPAGATLAYPTPTATDAVDAAPVVSCAPAAGTTVPPGTTTVTCTATDASGNAASAGFTVDVAYVPSHVATVTWGEPIGPVPAFVANRGRTIPVKATLAVDGVVRAAGSAALRISPCAGGPSITVPLAVGGVRWDANLDTSSLAGGCHTVTAVIDGLEAGSFVLDLRAPEAAKAKGRSR